MSSVDVSGTGSLVNAMYRDRGPVEPVVGMGATILAWTDRYAATVVAVSADQRRVYVTRDRAERTDSNGMSERQTYIYATRNQATPDCYTLRTNGRWVRRGESMQSGQAICLGVRNEYHDYSF